MSHHEDDIFWQRLMAADDPTIAEMEATEAALRQVPEPEPIAPDEVAALVAKAVAGPTPVPVAPSAKGRTHLVALMLLFVFAGSLAFVRNKAWLGRDAHFELTFATAPEVLACETQSDSERYAAADVLYTKCLKAMRAAEGLAEGGDPEAAARADALLRRWHECLHADRATVAPSEVAGELLQALEVDRPALRRVAALEAIAESIGAGMTLIATAELDDPIEAGKLQAIVNRMRNRPKR